MLRLLIALCLLLVHAPAYAQQADQVMTGEITGADHETYKQIPFDVPDGARRITVRLSYDKANRTVVDLGLFDPERFRGWSGGTRNRFTIAASDASPGYLPGALPAGRWHVQLGVPNARKDARSPYRVEVFLDRGAVRNASAAIADGPVRTGPGWFRGDLHMHDAHSDGSCTSKAGRKVPCPLFRTVDAAARAGLDFVAVTDHNTVAHFAGLRELQPYYDDILLIPGTEITTFGGHANAIGLDRWVDFRIGTPGALNVAAMEKAVEEAGAILSINHPALPSGEACMGCGWIWPDTDWAGIAAVEAINANTVDTPLSGIGFWYKRLNAGNRLTTIAAGARIDVTATIAGVAAGKAVLVANGAEVRSLPVGPAVAFRLDRKAACGWVAVNVTTEGGKLLLVGNPIYVVCR